MSSTFSETWYRVANARLGLLPTVAIHKQRFRGRDWYVLRDTYTQRFFRITPHAYAFVSRLSPERTVDEVWLECLELQPQDSPGQEEVLQVLGQLHHSNLLYYRTQPDSLAIFERYKEYRQRELMGKLLGFLYVRIPLWDPNDWLNRNRRLVDACVGWQAAILWGLVLFGGLVAALQDSARLFQQTQGMLSLDNLPWLYLCIAGMKVLHEFGHGFVVKRFGGDVHTMGLMFLILVPLPYIDATGSWAFRNRGARALVGAAGILVELFLAACGAMVWALTGDGLLNSLAFNVMITGSVSSLLFNGNPLLRFDAYYVLSDVVDIPNLYQRASQQWFYFADRYLLGTPKLESPARDRREWWWLTGYGGVSFFYRMFIVGAILLVVADQWFAVGMLFAFSTFIMLVAMPLYKWFRHLAGPNVYRNRRRALGVSAALFFVPLFVLAWFPAPNAIRAPGLIQAVNHTTVTASTSGRLEAIEVEDGQWVEAGQVVLRLSSRELELELSSTSQQIIETLIMRNQALGRSFAEVAPLEQRILALQEREAETRRKIEQLVVRARHAGVWVAPQLHERLGNWVARGQTLGELADNARLRFLAVVSQEQASKLFAGLPKSAELRLNGQAGAVFEPISLNLLPFQRQSLASAALGWAADGPIPVASDDADGLRALETFYEVEAVLDGVPPATAYHGMTGWMRIPLPSEPLFAQLRTFLMQLLQKRYQL